MKKVIIAIALQAIVFVGWGQDSKPLKHDSPDAFYQSQTAEKMLIADETKFTDLKGSVKIETENETIYNKLVKEMDSALKYVTIRHDKALWILYFKRDKRADILAWFKKLNGE